MSLSPPPPLPPVSSEFHFPVIAIALIGITATGILLISYYVFVIKCCLHLHRVDVLSRVFSRHRNLDAGTSPATSSAATPGLDDAVIRSIPVIKFRKSSVGRKYAVAGDGDDDGKNDKNQSGIECAVCLCEFEEGEKIRVIPNCCHGFHIDCIDIWLQNCANCPLCRSPVSASSMINNNNIINKFGNGDNTSNDNDDYFSGDDDDYVVIEIQGNNLDEPRLITRTNSSEQQQQEQNRAMLTKKLKQVYSMGDELIDSMRKKDDEFRVQPIRRSISMDMSSNTDFCIEMQEYCRNCDNNVQVNEVISCSNNDNSNNSSKVRRSIFTFGYGRSSRGSIQPIHLDLDP
ncbi:hypothetical protein RND81_05G066500 [Saponaria officinalis]|uniref:RING-type E3 ubiquitin transferase n=1 Tax=Saponaria officinalis TaxID=3572 RepID=A0AAW1KVI1_SAPOF